MAMAEALVIGSPERHRSLTVLYDERCPLCRRLKAWLAGQATLVPIHFVTAGGEAARRLFPDLDHERTTTVLTVVTERGEVYEGERAWLVCGWALPTWQPLAERFSGRRGRRVAAVAARAVDAYRHRRMEREWWDDLGCDRCRIAAPPPPP
jgi:predicted DCC family thiol-disulfide oxidoreductase YuxK